MNTIAAVLLALAVIAAQVLHGGMFFGALTWPSYALLLAAAPFALWCALRNPHPTSPGAIVGVAVFAAYIVWRCAHAPDADLGRLETDQVLAGGVTFFAAYAALTRPRPRLIFLGVLLAWAAVQAGLAFFQFAQRGGGGPFGWFASDLQSIYAERFPNRGLGTFLNPNQLAWFLVWSAVFAAALAAWGRFTVVTRIVLGYLALMCVGALVVTGSRGGMASLIAAVLMFVGVSLVAVVGVMRRGRVGPVAGALVLMALLLGAGYLVYSSNWVAQGRVGSIGADDVRFYLLEHGVRLWQTAPLLGQGPGAFVYGARLYRTGGQSFDALFAHNDWLQTLVEYGFVGVALALVAVALLVGAGVRRCLAALRAQTDRGEPARSNTAAAALAATCVLIAYSVHSFIDFNMHVPANALLAAATFGLLAGAGTPAQRGPGLRVGVLRGATALAILAFTAALGMSMHRHAVADYQQLLARNALADGRVRDALAAAEIGLAGDPAHARLLTARGEALYAYEAALLGEAEDPEAELTEDAPVVELADEQRRDLYQRSADAFTRALVSQPRERQLHIFLAGSLLEVGDTAAARAALLEAIRLDPGHGYAYGVYGDFLDAVEDPWRARRFYEVGAALPGWESVVERLEVLNQFESPEPEDEPLEDEPSEEADPEAASAPEDGAASLPAPQP